MTTALIIAGIWGTGLAAFVWLGTRWQDIKTMHRHAEGQNWPRV